MTPHCQHCGGLIIAIEGASSPWPKVCRQCGKFGYNSPKPVVIMLVRTWQANGQHPGLLVVKRGIQPYKGSWALPSGYIDYAEDWRDATIREAREELGVKLNRDRLKMLGIVTTPSNFLMMFVTAPAIQAGHQPWTTHDLTNGVNDQGDQEVLAIDVMTTRTWRERPLGPPSHQQYLESMYWQMPLELLP